MEEERPSTHQKALRINLDPEKFGTFAEIGAGQEVVRSFFHVGKASGTVAKSISAYDTVVSDDIYGPTDHYVSRHRLTAMLDYEYNLLLKRLDEKRGAATSFFVFAETVATRSRPNYPGGHGWLGIRFQPRPRTQPSEIIIHVQLLDPVTTGEQEALGAMGVNLIYAAFYERQDPNRLISTLMDSLSRNRIEVDVIRFSGSSFDWVDNRLVSLQLVQQGLTDAAMFTAGGDVVQAAEVLSGEPVLIERGSFRPVTNITLEMHDRALAQFRDDRNSGTSDPVALMEMTLSNLMTDRVIDHRDFLARVDTLGALGKMVLISNYTRFDQVTVYLRKYTKNWIAMVMGVPILREIFDEKYYSDLPGGVLESLGRLFQGPVKLYVYPARSATGGDITTAETLEVPAKVRHLYAHLVESGFIEPIREFRAEQLHVRPGEVLAQIQSGDPAWEQMVPIPVAGLIRQRHLFGWRDRRPPG